MPFTFKCGRLSSVVYFGTSGFSYKDWVGGFYPPGMPQREWLFYYSREFNTCEINSTFYAIPKLSTMESMVKRTGEGFLFSVKANQEMTHRREDNEEVFIAFHKMLEPLVEAGKLGCVLAQFPYSFRPGRHSREYLELFKERMGELAIVIEFRNDEWLREEVFDWLRQNRLGFCCVDEPPLPRLIPPLAEATSRIAYVRFHGRNAAKWWQHEHAYERYDYSYSREELTEWLPRIRDLERASEKTFVFANNHWRGQAVDTIRQLRMMFD